MKHPRNGPNGSKQAPSARTDRMIMGESPPGVEPYPGTYATTAKHRQTVPSTVTQGRLRTEVGRSGGVATRVGRMQAPLPHVPRSSGHVEQRSVPQALDMQPNPSVVSSPAKQVP